ncbi:MAG: hypothetical protein K5656_06600 [Lachnospiraceae bacterium]|nr:hypothetical protein [Lachnospiraceae bacterium]
MSKKKMKEGFNSIPTYERDEEVKDFTAKNAFAVLIIVLVAMVALLCAIKLDVGGFGSKVLRPILEDVPVMSTILPEKTDEQVSEETGYKSLAQAVTRIQQLEEEVGLLKAKEASGNAELTNEDKKKIAELEKKIKKLQVYEKNQKSFDATKEEFYKEVVYNDNVDIEDYIKWYESMDADTAAKLYKEAVQTKEATAEEKELAESYAAMKPVQAARILETMTADLDIVVNILNEMSPEERGKIMGEMSSAYAAKVTKKMSS